MIVTQLLDGLPRTDAPPRIRALSKRSMNSPSQPETVTWLTRSLLGHYGSHPHAPRHSWFSPISSDRGGADRPPEGGGHYLQAPSRRRSIRGSHVVSGSRRQERVGAVVDAGSQAHGCRRPGVGAVGLLVDQCGAAERYPRSRSRAN